MPTHLFLFDVGGTLVDDPFIETLDALRTRWNDEEPLATTLSETSRNALLDQWRHENATYDFPLASHFLQEEVWITRALGHLARRSLIQWHDIPALGPQVLEAYRKQVRLTIQAQPQLASVEKAFKFLETSGALIGVASNDREFATRTMLRWTGLERHIKWTFTSEGLSSSTQIIEKPSTKFFEAVDSEVAKAIGTKPTSRIYVGDNETNDVETPRRAGYITVRFFNRRNLTDFTWLDNRSTTQADYSYTDAADLEIILRRIFAERCRG